MKFLWCAEDAAAATAGQSKGDWQATGVSIDTRSIEKGDLFVALKDIRDGHEFVADALNKGAAAALVSYIPDGVSDDAPLLIVPDVLEALRDLGKAARERTKAKVVGVTGSAGKTSTKEMLRTVLAEFGTVHAAEKSFNNHWGVPLTLARMPVETDFAVIEIGMNHPGEIAPLATLAQLDIAIITNVAPVHLAAFKNVSEIAVEKAAIVRGLKPNGVAIYNDMLETVDILNQQIAHCASLTFGRKDAKIIEIETVHGETKATVSVMERILTVSLQTLGKHFVENALAVLLTIHSLSLDLARATTALQDWQPPTGRGETWLVDEITLIDDAYNANPLSVRAGLDVLSTAQGQRRVALLGDMLELGSEEQKLHTDIAQYPAIHAIDVVFCVGPLMKNLYDALPPEKRGDWCATSAEMARTLAQKLHKQDVVLVKGSLGSKMGLLVNVIKSMGKARKRNEDPS